MKIVLSMDFGKRSDLDAFVLSRLGSNEKDNLSHELEISPEEAETLGLSGKSRIYGVKCIIKK